MMGHDTLLKLEEYVGARQEVSNFSGTVLVSSAGTILLNKGFGLADREKQIPCRDVTRYWLASISKLFTTLAVFRLVEERRIRLDDDIAKYFTDWPCEWRDVKVTNLLTHSSGITRSAGDVARCFLGQERNDKALEQLDRVLEFSPGGGFSYNNAGFVLLDCLIERISKKSFAEYYHSSILAPMDLRATTVGLGQSGHEPTACGYGLVKGEVVKRVESDVATPDSGPWGVVSNTRDLYLLERALHGGTFFSRESLELMWRPVSSTNGHYGHGWLVGDFAGRKVVGHDGGSEGFSTSYRIYPDSEDCIVVLSNFDTAPAIQMTADLAAILHGEKYEIPKKRVAIRVDESELEGLVGTYEFGGYAKTMSIRREGQRLFGAIGEGDWALTFEMFAEAPLSYFSSVADQPWEFRRGATGAIEGFSVQFGLESWFCKKLL
jgi:CubicO group peptidase (beta-lactamase class C family)